MAMLLAATLSLSGCLLTRVYAFKHQFCDYERNFALSLDDEARLYMRKPVLYDSDVVWLVGAPPTHTYKRADVLKLIYVVEKDVVNSDSKYSIPVSLQFAQTGSRYRLQEGIIHQNLTTILSPALIASTVLHTCQSRPDLLGRKVVVDLSAVDADELPTRADILDALGPPQDSLLAGRILKYRYRLQNVGPDADRTHIVAWFGPDGKSMERLHLRYFRYELDADFIAKRAWISVRL